MDVSRILRPIRWKIDSIQHWFYYKRQQKYVINHWDATNNFQRELMRIYREILVHKDNPICVDDYTLVGWTFTDAGETPGSEIHPYTEHTKDEDVEYVRGLIDLYFFFLDEDIYWDEMENIFLEVHSFVGKWGPHLLEY